MRWVLDASGGRTRCLQDRPAAHQLDLAPSSPNPEDPDQQHDLGAVQDHNAAHGPPSYGSTPASHPLAAVGSPAASVPGVDLRHWMSKDVARRHEFRGTEFPYATCPVHDAHLESREADWCLEAQFGQRERDTAAWDRGG